MEASGGLPQNQPGRQSVSNFKGFNHAIPQLIQMIEKLDDLALQLKLLTVASGRDGIAAQFDIAPNPCPTKLRFLVGDGQYFDASELQPAH